MLLKFHFSPFTNARYTCTPILGLKAIHHEFNVWFKIFCIGFERLSLLSHYAVIFAIMILEETIVEVYFLVYFQKYDYEYTKKCFH